MNPLLGRSRRHEVGVLLRILLVLIELEASTRSVETIGALSIEVIVPFLLKLILNQSVHLDCMVVVHKVVHLTWRAGFEVGLIQHGESLLFTVTSLI